MRELTQYEKDQLATEYSEDAPATAAVTIEWQYKYRLDPDLPDTSPTIDKNFYWEEMVFPAEIIGGGTVMRVARTYIENPIFFASTDSPDPEVTGTLQNFLQLANDTVWWNPEADAVQENATTNRDTLQAFKTTVVPGQIWARVIKAYTFDEFGAINTISRYVLKEEEVDIGDYTIGMGVVDVFTDADYYYFYILSTTNGGSAAIDPSGPTPPSSIPPRIDPVPSVIPEGEGGTVNLLSNGQEAAEYINRVTLTGGAIENDVYADRARAQENLAEALWGIKLWILEMMY